MNKNGSHLRGENGFWGESVVLRPSQNVDAPQFALQSQNESSAYQQRATGRNGANSPRAVRGERGEKPRRLSPTPLPTPSPSTDHLVTTERTVSNKRLPLDPDIAAWARACRDVFGPGVKLYPDRYAHLWGGK